MNQENKDLDRLKIILKYFPSTPEPGVIVSLQNYLESIIDGERRSCGK